MFIGPQNIMEFRMAFRVCLPREVANFAEFFNCFLRSSFLAFPMNSYFGRFTAELFFVSWNLTLTLIMTRTPWVQCKKFSAAATAQTVFLCCSTTAEKKSATTTAEVFFLFDVGTRWVVYGVHSVCVCVVVCVCAWCMCVWCIMYMRYIAFC